jgi:hypothetical protein
VDNLLNRSLRKQYNHANSEQAKLLDRVNGAPKLNRVIATLTLFLGLATMMFGVYAEQWTTIQLLVRQFIPFFG